MLKGVDSGCRYEEIKKNAEEVHAMRPFAVYFLLL